MLNLRSGFLAVVLFVGHAAPLSAADVFQPTDDPAAVAALADYGPTRWRKPTGDFYYMSLYGPLVTDRLLPHLNGLKQLSGLDLIRSRVTDDGLAEIARLPKLTELNLKETSIGDTGAAHLAALNNLRSLNLAQTKITDASLAKLEGLVRLQSLELADTQTSDAGVAQLARLTDLTNLSLDGTGISDAALAKLAPLQRLRSLSLQRTGITDAGVTSLVKLTGLRDLYLKQSRVTAAGISKLQQALPQCRIHSGAGQDGVEAGTSPRPRLGSSPGHPVESSPGHPPAARETSTVPRQIVIAPDAPPAVKYAAEEFQRYFAQATGVKLPIETKAEGQPGHVFVGVSDGLKTSAAHVDPAGLGPEDLQIRVRGPEIALVGGGPRGTLYAVYAYLEDVLGIRFLTSNHTHVPRTDVAKLPQQFDKNYRPPFGYRFVYYRQNMRDPEFGARLRNNVYAGQERFGGAARSGLVGHSMEHFVPTAKYGKSHPEYFALVDGKRRSVIEDSDSSPRGTQLCLTNPDVRRLIVDGVLASLKKNPDQQLISVGHSDNYFYCQCPECQAVNDREASTMGTMLQVVNEAADAIVKDYPDAYIGTYAYQITRRPPKHLRPRPNVVLQFATIEACQMHGIPDAACPRNAELFADLTAWQGLTRQLFIWNYNTVFPDYMLPCPNLYNVEPNVRLFAEVGSPGAFMQCCAESEGTDLHELRNYLICNLMWDPTRSQEKLIDEFLTLHYGPAADTMRKWIALTHDRKRLRDFHCHPFGGPQMYGITPELGKKGIKLLDDAIAATDDPAIKERLERVLVAPLRATIWEAIAIQRENKDKPAAELKKLDPQRAVALRPNVERFYRICDKFGVTHVGEARPNADERKEMATLFAAAGVPLQVPGAKVE